MNSSKIAEIRHRGAVVIRGVLPQAEALALKQSAKDYIAANKGRVRAFPVDKPAVYELYWSPPQLQARAHHNMLTTQVALQRLWHSSDPNTELSTRHPVSYADRLRMRQPGDAGFSLGAHCDGGGLERWEDEEYRRVYTRILEGHWEEYDPYDAKHRLGARMDLYGTRGGCTMFRMWQGWVWHPLSFSISVHTYYRKQAADTHTLQLSMSNTGPGEGTLKLFPLLRESTAYTMLRPFFTSPSFAMATASDSTFPGSVPAAGQEFNPTTHPHLDLDHTMTSVPRVAPGDFVAWHCDALHAVDPLHGGTGDASVLYIPATPLCALNAKYARHQRDAFKAGSPPADFPGAGGPGESGFVGGLDWEARLSEQGKRAMGFGGRGWEVTDDMTQGERRAVEIGNSVLFEGR